MDEWKWTLVSVRTPPIKRLVLVQEIIEDDGYPEQILIPELGWREWDGTWRAKSDLKNGGRVIKVRAWAYLPLMDDYSPGIRAGKCSKCGALTNVIEVNGRCEACNRSGKAYTAEGLEPPVARLFYIEDDHA